MDNPYAIPWHVEFPQEDLFWLVGSDDKIYAEFFTADEVPLDDEDKKCAAFILQAVNAHDGMVAELEAIRRELAGYSDDPILLGLQLRAIRALALAKGESQ